MPDIRMLVSALTDVGRARTTNEDACVVTDLASGRLIESLGADHTVDVHDRGVLLALSDGMGGHQAGEVASALVLESLRAALADETLGALHEQLEEAVLRANKQVKSAAQTRERRGMGATLTAVMVRGREAYIAEVGDSRAYLLRNGRLRQITRDQSLVQFLIDQGMLSAEEARHAPEKNVILQAVGLADDVRVAIARLELRRADRLLLCSDGVSNAVSDDELRQILTGSEPRAACETMIALANDRGGLDNQTAIVADLSGEALEPPDEFETVTSTYEVLKAYEATIAGEPMDEATAWLAGEGAAPAAVTIVAEPADGDDDDDAAAAAVGSGGAAAAAGAPAGRRRRSPAETQRIPRRGAGPGRGVVVAAVVIVLAVLAVVLAVAR
jgi:PPM family protein phosphatase